MIEGIVVGIILYVICSWVYNYLKQRKARRNAIRIAKASPAFSGLYGRQDTPMSQYEWDKLRRDNEARHNNFYGDIVASLDEVVDAVSTRSRSSRSSDDSWGGSDD